MDHRKWLKAACKANPELAAVVRETNELIAQRYPGLTGNEQRHWLEKIDEVTAKELGSDR